MDDKQQITELYNRMYRAMIEKDTAILNAVHADSFVLVHMTGMRQSKQEYIGAIANGTLNYFSVQNDELVVTVDGDTAQLIGKSRVEAAVFGGGRHTWRLQLNFRLAKIDGRWKFTESRASTY